MASPDPPPSNFPPAMGPGAQPRQPGKDRQSLIAEIAEMRRHYSIAVEPTQLKIGYLFDGARRNYDINWDAAPLSGFKKWLCYGGRARATISGTFLLDMLRGAENMTGRPMSQTEAESFTLHSAKRMTYGFIGIAVSLGSGYALAWRGAKTMKFPFKKTKPLEAYDFFPLRRFPLLQGTYARSAWQVTRANIYAALGIVFLSPLFRGMGESVMAVGLYADTRTRETVKAMKGGFDRVRMNRSSSSPRGAAPPQGQPSTDGSQSNDFYGGNGNEAQQYYGKSTDYAGDRSFSDNTTDTGALSDSAMRQRESQQSAPTSYGTDRYPRSNQSYGQAAQTSTSTSTSSSSSDFFFDDASPTAGNDPNMSTPNSYTRGSSSGGGGNAWDRIRRGGGGQSQQTSPQSSQSPYPSPQQSQNSSQTGGGWRTSSSLSGQNDVETRGDSFAFSTSDSNRALAKEQAQKEFDAMLDKERRESGSGDYDRNSYATESGNDAGTSSSSGSAWDRRRRGN